MTKGFHLISNGLKLRTSPPVDKLSDSITVLFACGSTGVVCPPVTVLKVKCCWLCCPSSCPDLNHKPHPLISSDCAITRISFHTSVIGQDASSPPVPPCLCVFPHTYICTACLVTVVEHT